MQPYFLPYTGYFQLIGAVDLFVVYDNIKYTKKGWINRNRFLQNGSDAVFSLPLKGASDSLDVRERELAADFARAKLLSRFRGAYSRAPHFAQAMPVIEEIVGNGEHNLFKYIHASICRLREHLDLKTEIITSSDIAIDHELTGQEKVLAICRAAGAKSYVNAIGGTELYSREEFRRCDVTLQFIKSRPFEYAQFGNPFVASLSIVDSLMFNPLRTVQDCVLNNYDLI